MIKSVNHLSIIILMSNSVQLSKETLSMETSTGICVTITGPMFAGKTTALINIIRELRKTGVNVLVFKHAIDDRYATVQICSHDKAVEECIPINNTRDIFTNELYESAQVIIVEEAQFFGEDINDSIDRIKCDKKKLIMSGLSGSYKQKAIGYMGDIFAKSEKIIQLTAICAYCKKVTPAQFTAKVGGTNSVIEVGSDIYKPVCSEHFHKYSRA